MITKAAASIRRRLVQALKRIIVGNAACLLGVSIFSQDAAAGPDGKYLFFSRERSDGSDIYWVSVKAFLTAR
jgi:hypothetical protein